MLGRYTDLNVVGVRRINIPTCIPVVIGQMIAGWAEVQILEYLKQS
jgi:hypothetical protein